MPKFKEWLFGKKGKTKKLSTKTPEQEELMKLINEGLATGEGAFGDIFGKFNEEEFNKGVSEPALKNFQDKVLPMLQEKFIANNQVLGSGMQRAQAGAATDLQSKLAELMYNAQNQQKQNRITGAQTLLGTNAVENIYKPPSKGVAQGVLESAAEGAGKMAGAAVAG